MLICQTVTSVFATVTIAKYSRFCHIIWTCRNIFCLNSTVLSIPAIAHGISVRTKQSTERVRVPWTREQDKVDETRMN